MRLPGRRSEAGRPPSGSQPIDHAIKALEEKARNAAADAELRRLDEAIPLSPIPKIAPPHRPLANWAATATNSAADAAAQAAKKRAVQAEAERATMRAAAVRAKTEAEAAEAKAAAAAREAEQAAEAAAAQRQKLLGGGEQRRRPKPTALEDLDMPPEPELLSLREAVAANDWVAAARAAVAMAIRTSVDDAISVGAVPPEVLPEAHELAERRTVRPLQAAPPQPDVPARSTLTGTSTGTGTPLHGEIAIGSNSFRRQARAISENIAAVGITASLATWTDPESNGNVLQQPRRENVRESRNAAAAACADSRCSSSKQHGLSSRRKQAHRTRSRNEIQDASPASGNAMAPGKRAGGRSSCKTTAGAQRGSASPSHDHAPDTNGAPSSAVSSRGNMPVEAHGRVEPRAPMTPDLELTPRRLRARMLEPEPFHSTDSFEVLVSKAGAARTAKEALREEADSSGHLSFIGASHGAIDRTLRAAATKAAADWTAASAEGRAAQQRAAEIRAAVAEEASVPWDPGTGSGSAFYDRHGDIPWGGHSFPPPRPSKVDLSSIEAAEARRFQKLEIKRAQKDDPDRPSARGARIVELVQELDAPRQVRDFDSEIATLLTAAGAKDRGR